MNQGHGSAQGRGDEGGCAHAEHPEETNPQHLQPITEDDRWAQLRRCLHDQTLPTEVRAAGALVLLFGLPVSRITALRHTDIHTDADGTTWLQMTQHPLLIPDAIATLLRNQCEHGIGAAILARTTSDGWCGREPERVAQQVNVMPISA